MAITVIITNCWVPYKSWGQNKILFRSYRTESDLKHNKEHDFSFQPKNMHWNYLVILNSFLTDDSTNDEFFRNTKLISSHFIFILTSELGLTVLIFRCIRKASISLGNLFYQKINISDLTWIFFEKTGNEISWHIKLLCTKWNWESLKTFHRIIR